MRVVGQDQGEVGAEQPAGSGLRKSQPRASSERVGEGSDLRNILVALHCHR